MKAYVDTSALLRVVLREPGQLDLRRFDALISSELVAVEALRTLDRLRLQNVLTIEDASARGRIVAEWLEAFDLVLLRSPVLSLAGEPVAVALGTLDALHLATARIWRDRMSEPLIVATHDATLALAARAYGFDVAGA